MVMERWYVYTMICVKKFGKFTSHRAAVIRVINYRCTIYSLPVQMIHPVIHLIVRSLGEDEQVHSKEHGSNTIW